MRQIGKLRFVVAIALLATAIGTSSASASRFMAGQYPASIKIGGAEGGFVFSFNGHGYECGTPEFTASIEAATTTLTPTSVNNVNCVGPLNEKATLEMNKCSFIYRPGEAKFGGGFTGTFDIGPSGCGAAVLKGPWCVREFSPQSGHSGNLTYENVEGKGGTEAVRIKSSATGLKYSQHGGSCGTATNEDGHLQGTWLAQAYDVGGEFANLHIDDKTGLYTGAGGFEAEYYPAPFLGEQSSTGKHVFSMQGWTTECETANLAGEMLAASGELAAAPSYEGCHAVTFNTKFPALLVANTCHYVFHTGGTMDVACSKEGDAVEIKTYENTLKEAEGKPLCVYSLGAQNGRKGITYTNVGTGTSRGIGVGLGVKTLKYSITGNELLCGSGTLENGNYAGSSTLYGVPH